jgi:hypothetical protein
MGFHVMRYRARLIGGHPTIAPGKDGGMEVVGLSGFQDNTEGCVG